MSDDRRRSPARLSRELTVGPLRLRLHEWPGSRDVVVCLPGITANGRTFDVLGHQLAPDWRVLALDPRGRGESDKPGSGYGYQVHVGDLLSLLDQFGFERAVLVGHSYGAVIALMAAAWCPERIRGLVLVDGGAPIPRATHETVARIIATLDAVYPSLESYLGLLRLAPWLQPWTPELEAFFRVAMQPVAGGFRAQTARHAVEQDVAAFHAGPPDFAALQAAVRCPTLVVKAGRGFLNENDHVVPPGEYQEMLRRIPQARGVVVQTANHFTVMLGPATETIQHIQEFLDGLRMDA